MDLNEQVREKYGQAALRVKSGGSSCCGSAPGSVGCVDPITSNLYDSNQTKIPPRCKVPKVHASPLSGAFVTS